MSDLAGRTSAGTVSVYVVLGVAVVALLALGVTALWRRFSAAGKRGWAALVPGYNLVVLRRVRATSPAPKRRARALRGPVAAAAAGAVLVVALVLGYFLATDPAQPEGALDNQEQQAVTAAGTIAANLSTYSRTSFTHDFDRALAQTTGQLHSQVAGLRSKTQSALTEGKFDLSAKVRHTALVGPADPSPNSKNPSSYVVLVNLYGYQSSAPTTPIPQNLQVTVERSKGQWVASDVRMVGIQ